MRHIVIQDKDCIRSIEVTRITSSLYMNGRNYFELVAFNNRNEEKTNVWTFTFENAEAALDAYEEFLNIIQGEDC